jgi:epoxyqueuosine reductase
MEEADILADLQQFSKTLGFSHLGISDIDLSEAEPRLQAWLEKGFYGEMHFMAKHGTKRSRPAELVPHTISVITVSLPYLSVDKNESWARVHQSDQAYIARYALGEDYHAVMKDKLKQLAEFLKQKVGAMGYRVFVDSAPVLEVEVAQKAGLGWRGKHTLLPFTAKATSHCGSCERCITVCPTQAIISPYQLDARRCIAYLTIELKGAIPIEFRSMIGNRIYGCDDCQLVCPWNKYAKLTQEIRLYSLINLEAYSLLELWAWSEDTFTTFLEKSPIFRIGYLHWRRNLAVGLGNAPFSHEILRALVQSYVNESSLVQEHIAWALDVQLDNIL